MKKLPLVVFLTVIIVTSLSAWEPKDLTKYPSFTKEGDWILNAGIGFGLPVFSKDYTYIPHIRLSFDRNTSIGDKKLPFFLGGIVGYSGEGHYNIVYRYYPYRPYYPYYFFYPEREDWFVNRFSVGVRFGYHFNWDVDNLDTYAVTTAGVVLHAGTNYHPHFSNFGVPLLGVAIGARYFITKGFGFWTELGYGTLSLFDIGISIKF